jgi:hypothetical protein
MSNKVNRFNGCMSYSLCYLPTFCSSICPLANDHTHLLDVLLHSFFYKPSQSREMSCIVDMTALSSMRHRLKYRGTGCPKQFGSDLRFFSSPAQCHDDTCVQQHLPSQCLHVLHCVSLLWPSAPGDNASSPKCKPFATTLVMLTRDVCTRASILETRVCRTSHTSQRRLLRKSPRRGSRGPK